MNLKQDALVVVAFALLALPGYSQPASTGAQPKGSTGASTPSRTAILLTFIHHANNGELEMASLEKQNGSSPQVKDFADQIIKDHKADEDKMMRYADSHNIDMAAVSKQLSAMREQAAQRAMDDRDAKSVGGSTGEWAAFMSAEPGAGGPNDHIKKQEAEVQKLSTLKGPELDREFIKAMVSDHQAIIKRLTHARTRVNEPDAVALIDKTLPTANKHLSTAKSLQDTLARAP